MRSSGKLFLGSSLVICSFVTFGLLQSGQAGRTIKLPHYDVTFGKWPLMEVTRTRSLFKSGRSHGGRHHGPPPPPKIVGSSPITGLRLGPPPAPGKLVLLRPRQNKGMIRHHLQTTLKQFASNKLPTNMKLPIIVKATGPNPPPPPPGYQLGGPSGTVDSGWKPGPPPVSGKYTGPRSSRLLSMLQTAASSGIFTNAASDTYVHPEFSPGPPLTGTFMTFQPDGTQVVTHVNGDFEPSGPLRSGQGVETKPSVPPVIKIGDPVPENYTVLYAERQILGVKAPDTLEKSVENSGANEYEVGINLGTKYEQGYGRKPNLGPPLEIIKFHKRGDLAEPVKKLVQQDLPESGLIITSNLVVSSPNISAPLGGKTSPHFQKALEEKLKVQKSRKKEKPLDAQVKLLGRLFTKLQRLQPPKFAVPEDELDDGKHAKPPSSGWGWTEDESEWKKDKKTKVDSPVMAVQIQTFSAPEVNSSDADILESMAEFGTHDVEFADTDEIVTLMETALKHGSSRIKLSDLGSSPQEINQNMLNWVRRHLAVTRDVVQQVHSSGEKLASQQFKQYQTFVTPPFGSNGWGPGEPMPVDPKVGRRSMPMTNTHMLAAYKPPQV